MYRWMYGQGGHYLIWPRRVSATEQGLVFKAWSRTLGIQVHYLVSWRVCLSNSSPGLFPWKLGGGALSTRLGSLSNDDSDVNENGKKAIGFRIGKTTALHVHHAFFVHFFAVTARPQRENAKFHVLWSMWKLDNDFLFLFLNFDTVFQNLTPEKIANIWLIKRDGISAIKCEAARLHFLSDIFVAVAVAVA